jgi:hypothetical protein
MLCTKSKWIAQNANENPVKIGLALEMPDMSLAALRRPRRAADSLAITVHLIGAS